MPEDWLEVYEHRAGRLSNNLRLNETSILTFFQLYCKINRNQLEIVVKANYDLHSNKCLLIVHLIFWGRSLVMRRFGLHSNSWSADEIKGLPFSMDIRNTITELLLLKKEIRRMFTCEFCEISDKTFFKEPFGRLLLHKHLSSFQKWCHTYFPAEYFLDLIWRLGTRVSSIF